MFLRDYIVLLQIIQGSCSKIEGLWEMFMSLTYYVISLQIIQGCSSKIEGFGNIYVVT